MLSSGLVHRALDAWCHVLYRAAARIVVLSPGFKETLVGRGVPAEKIDVIYNWSAEQPVQTATCSRPALLDLGLANRFNVVFAGTMGKVQALDAVLEAARMTAVRLPSVQFVFIGGGVEVPRLRQRAAEMALDNVRFLPRLPLSEIGGVLRAADVLLVHLADHQLFRITVPSKTQAYMAAGRPILMGVKGDAAWLVEQARCGVVCEPESAASIAAAVEQLSLLSRRALDAMGDNGRRFYREHLSMSRAMERFDRVFRSAMHGRVSKPALQNAPEGSH
jgi:glycosyltransferase involved in cell wall biosynthesis